MLLILLQLLFHKLSLIKAYNKNKTDKRLMKFAELNLNNCLYQENIFLLLMKPSRLFLTKFSKFIAPIKAQKSSNFKEHSNEIQKQTKIINTLQFKLLQIIRAIAIYKVK